MAARTAAASTMPMTPAPSGAMASSSDPILRLAETRLLQNGTGLDSNRAEASALPSMSNEAVALHISKGKGKG